MTGDALRTTSDRDGPVEETLVRLGDRRARRRSERREAVYRVAIDLFVSRGFDSTTMDDIAAGADVARATVFNLFQRKVAFLEEWSALRRRSALVAIHAQHVDDLPLREVLTRYFTALARISERTRAETVACMGATIHSTNIFANRGLATEMRTFLARADLTQVRDGIDADQAGALIATAYFATLSDWIAAEPPPFDLQSRLLELLDLVFGGILAPEPPEAARVTGARRADDEG